MNQSDTIGKLAGALAKAQGDMPNAPKDNSGHHGKYATLGSVIRVLGLVLPKYGLSFVQTFAEPDCFHESSSQVSAPGSPSRGIVRNDHASAPVRASKARTIPGGRVNAGESPICEPTMIRSL